MSTQLCYNDRKITMKLHITQSYPLTQIVLKPPITFNTFNYTYSKAK